MPLDPKVKQWLEEMAAAGLPAASETSPEEARRLYRERAAKQNAPPEPVASIENRKIPGPGGEIPIRVYRPQGSCPFPALLYFHGGGWVIGDLNTHQSPCCALANAARCVVVAVDYRLAPEHKFPAAAEDCYAATRWVSENAPTLNIDTSQIAVGGDSAGGNLAAAVSLMARDRGGPAMFFQLLIYPVLNYNFETRSYQENATGYHLTQDIMIHYWKQYLRSDEDARNPYAAPLRATSLKGLPSALVLTAEYDPLRDEGQSYAARLKEAGVPVTARNYEGLIHGFLAMSAVLEQTKPILQEAAKVLRGAVADGRSTSVMRG